MYRAVLFLLVVALVVTGCTSAPRPVARFATLPEYTPPEPAPTLNDLEVLLQNDEEIATFAKDAPAHRLQVLVSVPTNDGGLRRLSFRADAEYFYPASAVKLCAAFGAVDKLTDLRASLSSRLRFSDGAATGKSRIMNTTLRSELEKSLVLDDDEAHDRLFDFVGPAELSARLANAGLLSARIAEHLAAADDRPAPIVELVARGKPILVPQRADVALPPVPPSLLVGDTDFKTKNIVSLRDLHNLLITIARPDLAERGKGLRSEADRKKLLELLGLLPSALKARAAKPADETAKPLHVAMMNALPYDTIRVHEHGGRGHGFVVENAYAIDETTGRSAFVTATMHGVDDDEQTARVMRRIAVIVARTFLSPAKR